MRALRAALVASARRMIADGWWASPPEASLATEGAVCRQLMLEVARSVGPRLVSAARGRLARAA